MFGRLQVELIGDHVESYREFCIHKDIKKARFAILLFAVPLVVFAFNDYLFFGLSSDFYGLVALRLVPLFYAVFELIIIGVMFHFWFHPCAHDKDGIAPRC
jgi:hypothetical protein